MPSTVVMDKPPRKGVEQCSQPLKLKRLSKSFTQLRMAILTLRNENSPPRSSSGTNVAHGGDLELVAVSETSTLNQPSQELYGLQSTYTANFTNYLPFVFHSSRRQVDYDSEEDATIAEVLGLIRDIMGKPLAAYSYKRTMVLCSEMLHSSTIVFTSTDHLHRYKLGQAVPWLRISAPYLSQIRPTTPFATFKLVDTNGKDGDTYCTLYTKQLDRVRRLSFRFTPKDGGEFTVVVFVNHFRPFADFTYKNTRFRIVGTPVALGYILGHKLRFKLTVLDDNMPSICDDTIVKQEGLFERLENRVPNPNNPLMQEDVYHTYSANSGGQLFVSESMPPFGAVSQVNGAALQLKRVAVESTFETYQAGDDNSVNDIDADNQVLNTVLLGMREVTVRTAYNIPQADTRPYDHIGGF